MRNPVVPVVSVLSSLFLVVTFSGCSNSESNTDSGTTTPAQPAAPAVVDATGGVSISAPSSSTPPPATPPGEALAAVAVPSADNNGEVRTRDDDGNALDGEGILKRALMQHVEGKGHPYPSRIEELVELGTLKNLPPAPAGKKWAIDPATRKIVLQ